MAISMQRDVADLEQKFALVVNAEKRINNMENKEQISQLECEGACDEHLGEIKEVEVTGWGTFLYCQNAINEDKRRGLIVTAL